MESSKPNELLVLSNAFQTSSPLSIRMETIKSNRRRLSSASAECGEGHIGSNFSKVAIDTSFFFLSFVIDSYEYDKSRN
jgi:hypothetical protein